MSKRLKYTLLCTTLVILLSGCNLPWQNNTEKTPSVVVKGPEGVSVSIPPATFDPGAHVSVEKAPSDLQPVSDAFTSIGSPVQIIPTKGVLHGLATLHFPFPAKLPTGITLNDLMITEYSPVVNAWLPIPARLDAKNRELIVTADVSTPPNGNVAQSTITGFVFHPLLPTKKSFLSKAWKVVSTNFDTVKDLADFAKDIAKDAIENHGDFLAGFFKRMVPPPPEVKCEGTTSRLSANVIDSLASPYVTTVCAQDIKDGSGKNTDDVELKVANTHNYPVWVSLPKGVELEAQAQETEYDHAEELLIQFVALSKNGGSFLLRGDHVSVLKVHLSQLQTNSRIIMHVEPITLVADMMMWLVDMVAGGKVTQWAKLFEQLKNATEIKEAFDTLTDCIGKGVEIIQGKYDEPGKTDGESGRKSLLLDVLKLVGTCAVSSAKAMYAIWSRIAGVVKEEAEGTNPLALMVTRFKFLYENPGMIDEWMGGLIAWLTPNNAGKVYIDLSINHNPLENVDWTKTPPDLDTGLGCNGTTLGQVGPNLGVTVDVKQFADITGDGEAEAFVAVACQGSTESWPDRLEVFDGASDPTNPQLITILLGYTPFDSNLSHDYGPESENLRIRSITVSGETATVKSLGWWDVSDGYACPTMQVTDTFTWNGKSFTRSPRSAVHLTCD